MNQILCEILLLWKTSVITRPYLTHIDARDETPSNFEDFLF